MYSNVTTSTRINSSSVHTYICVCFIQNQYNTSSFYTGFVDPIQYSTVVRVLVRISFQQNSG